MDKLLKVFLFCILNAYNIYKKKNCLVNLTYNTTKHIIIIIDLYYHWSLSSLICIIIALYHYYRYYRKLDGKQGSPEKWMTWVKKLSLKLNFSNIYYKLKFSHTFRRLVPFDLGPWKSIIGWRYNPNSMSLSILHF